MPAPQAAQPALIPAHRTGTLLIDGEESGSIRTQTGFNNFISWSGRDIGRDRGSAVSHYAAPFEFSGVLRKVSVSLDAPQGLDGDAAGRAEMARQ